MLDALRRKIGELTGLVQTFEESDYRVAAAALMVHVATADGVMEPSERRRLVEIVETRYGLDAADAKALIAAGVDQDKKAVDLAEFTVVLGRALDRDGRKVVLEMLWETAWADGIVHEFEEALVVRAATLLGLSVDEALAGRERTPERIVPD